MQETVVIDHRFRGPHTSGNGGYSCGLLASRLNGAVEATLKAPPPLDEPLELLTEDGTARLTHGDVLVGEAHETTLDLDAPPPPAFDAAADAEQRFVGFKDHALPECFVCGPNRTEGDGLRIFAGALDTPRSVATVWTPDDSLADENGRVAPEFMWSALDCPSYFAIGKAGIMALLGRMTARIDAQPETGAPLIVLGWFDHQDGRKYHTGTALYNKEGACVAVAKTLWIALKPS